MKLLLIEPRNSLVRPPQALHYIASAVNAAGHAAAIHDEALFAGSSDSLRRLQASDADVFGISVYTTPESIRRATEISRAIKTARSSGAIVIWGGWHPTLYPHDCLNDKCVDLIVRGPGEKTTCDLLNALQQRASLRTIQGILFREADAIVETPFGCNDETHLFPRLDYGLIDVGRYIESHDQGPGTFSYLTSRGCFGRCAFCSSRLIDKQRRFRKPMAQCIDELRQVVARYPVRRLFISDPVAFTNGQQAADLISIVRQAGQGKAISWRCDARIDVLSRLSGDIYKALARNGCSGFAIGIESGADRVLQLMHKDITEAQISKVLACMVEHGFHENLFWFMVGFPGETPEEASRTLALACRIRTLFPRSGIALTWYRPQLAGEASSAANRGAHMHIGGTSVGAAGYYLSASARRGDIRGGLAHVLKALHRRLLFARVKRRIFAIPIEYAVFKWRESLRSLLTESAPRH